MHEFRVPDMNCGHCEAVVRRTVAALDAQARVEVDLATKQVKVESAKPREALAAALAEAGYAAQ
ncbi:MAG: heavy-metal-associated domain-containing protein [Paucibacter sp.]|nr:heavy-metal-associated domain-containing protein [Roseateles sp.]